MSDDHHFAKTLGIDGSSDDELRAKACELWQTMHDAIIDHPISVDRHKLMLAIAQLALVDLTIHWPQCPCSLMHHMMHWMGEVSVGERFGQPFIYRLDIGSHPDATGNARDLRRHSSDPAEG